MKNFYALLFCVFAVFYSNGQTVYNLNDTNISLPEEMTTIQRQADSRFSDGVRVRPFHLNPQIRNHQNLQAGDQIVLQLFQDVTHPATILRKHTDVNGVTAVTLKLNTYHYAYAYLALSPDSYLITVDIPEENRKYSSRSGVNQPQAYMLQLDASVYQSPGCGVGDAQFNQRQGGGVLPQTPEKSTPIPGVPVDAPGPQPLNTGCHTMPDINDPAIIRILIAYTPAAESWANTNQGGISNVISLTMAHANQVSVNNNLGINFQLAHSPPVNYTEVTMGTDWINLQEDDDGFMDNVHDLRKDFDADLVALLNYYTSGSTAGIANLLTSKYGNNRAVFSVTRVNFAANSNTFIHEIGHTMGAMHNVYQASDPGPTNWENWSVNTWTAGWRWQGSDSNYYADLMSYQSPAEYVDGNVTGHIPYFSDPNHTHLGAAAGHATLADNARTLKEIKHYVARYKETIDYCRAGNAPLYATTALYINNVTMGDINNPSGASSVRYGDFTALTTCIIQGDSQTLDISVTNNYNSTPVKVWIDWNDDKTFDPVTELVYDSGTGAAQHTVNITSPLGVATGDKRMRIRTYSSSLSPVVGTACGYSSIGEVEDYTIRLEAAPVCTVAGVPQNVQTGGLTANTATLSWDSQTGLDHYELRYREVGAVTWTEISPIWYPYHTLTDLNFDTDYEAEVRSVCSGSPSAYSSVVLFTTTGYCQATYGGSLTITRVRVGDIDQASSGGTGYTDFTAVNSDLERGRTYSIKVNNNSGGNYAMAYAAYIDYNYNGSFDQPAELIWNQTSVLGSEVSGQFTVPINASLESSRLRIVMIYTNNTSAIPQPCAVAGSSGEVEDYTVNITPYTPCIVATIPTNLTPDILTESQATLSWDEVPGADYDLRYRETGAAVWIDVNGFFENTLTLKSLNNNTEYEAQVRSVCDGTPSAYSSSLIFTTLDYCLSSGDSNINIINVTFGNINQSSPGGTTVSSYTDFTNVSTPVNQGESYTISIESPGPFARNFRVWIDYNQNGNFEDSGELVLDVQNTSLSTVTGSIVIPTGADLGATRMRVSVKMYAPAQDPCSNFDYGEVEDYTINVLELVPCTTADIPDNFALSTLSDTEATLEWDVQTGAAFQLRYREPGAPVWIDEPETFNNSITLGSLIPATLYEAQVRSKCDGPTFSDYTPSLVFETLITPLVYCAAGATNTSSSFEKIANVTFNTINNNSTSTNGYEDFTHISTTVEKGETYSFSSTISNIWTTDQVIVWIDFNQNGDFTDPGEEVLVINTAVNPMGGSILIDNLALNGPTRMRVRLHDADPDFDPNPTPCGNSTYGQVEDYTVIITPSGYVFQNGSWSPENPVGVSTLNDDVYVINGTTTLTGDMLANNVFISESATLRTAHNITLDGNIDNDGMLLFQSNDSSTGQLDTFTGSITGSGFVTVERHIPARRAFRLLSTSVSTSGSIRDNWQEGVNNLNTSSNQNPSPGFGTHITGSTMGANGFDATASGNPSLFTLNNAAQSWVAAPNTNLDGLVRGKAYRLMVRGDRSIDVTSNSAIPTNTILRTTGTLHIGSYTFLDFSEVENDVNFFGNPYQAAVDMNDVILASTNINNAHYYVWDPTLSGINGRGAYVTIDLSDGTNTVLSDANQYLQPGQAAFVTTLANGPASLTFEEVHKNVAAPLTAVFSSDSRMDLRLYRADAFSTGSTPSDGLRLKFDNGNSNAITPVDAPKFYNLDENLASVNGGNLYSIESRALPLEGESIPLFTNQYRTTDYVFEIELSELTDVTAVLRDHYTGIDTELINNDTSLYAFNVDPANPGSSADDRFEIVFEELLETEDIAFGTGFVLFPNPLTGDTFFIATRNLEGQNVNVQVHSILGQSLVSQKLTVNTNGRVEVNAAHLATGIYTVTLSTEDGKRFTTKLINK